MPKKKDEDEPQEAAEPQESDISEEDAERGYYVLEQKWHGVFDVFQCVDCEYSTPVEKKAIRHRVDRHSPEVAVSPLWTPEQGRR